MNAEVRAATRLENQRTLITMAHVGGRNVWGILFEVSSDVFESFEDISAKSWTVIWAVSSCNHLYESMINAVITAENRPAYKVVLSIETTETEQQTDENKQRVDFLLPVLHHCRIVVFHCFRACMPTFRLLVRSTGTITLRDVRNAIMTRPEIAYRRPFRCRLTTTRPVLKAR